MARLPPTGFFLLLTVLLEIAIPATAIPSMAPSPMAASFTLSLIADRSSANRNDTITYTMWLNVTAGGQIQLAGVNLTVDRDLALQANASVTPAACGLVGANATFAEWQCSFLRTGRSYRWSVPALVDPNATLGRSRLATAQAVELGSGVLSPRTAQTSVWIVLAVLGLSVKASPSLAAQRGGRVDFNVTVANIVPPSSVNATDVRSLTGYQVRLSIGISPLLEVGNGTPRFVTRDNITPSEFVSVTFPGIVAAGASVGDVVWVNATLVYTDLANRSIGPRFAEQRLMVQVPPPLGPDVGSVVAVLAFALLAIFGAVLVTPVLGERNLTIDEVFLVHRSGILIQHLSRGARLAKDDDLVASMFVAIQDFVRDSFQTKATLDEFSFGGRKAAVLRGQHIVLAALLSRGSPRYLFPQLKAVERDLEQAHGAALADWDGRGSSLDQAGSILRAFIAGGYRRFRGWGR